MDANRGPRLHLPLSAETTSPPAEAPVLPADASLEDRVIAALHTCYDPEIPVNIYELGLIYDLKVDSAGAVAIRMTLTSPACPVAGALPAEVQAKVQAVPGVTSARVDLVWDPPWDKGRMSEAAQLTLGLFD
jgi:FeS assembly SUF system protein